MVKKEPVTDVSENNYDKLRWRRCRRISLVFLLAISCSCILSILTHSLLSQSDTQEDFVAEICVGEISHEGDPFPIKHQGVWISSPFLPDFTGNPMSFVITRKIICGIIPWSSGLPQFKMIMIRPLGVYSPY